MGCLLPGAALLVMQPDIFEFMHPANLIHTCPKTDSAIPLVLFHVHISVLPDGNAFGKQPFQLFREMRGKPARTIDYPMAWVISVIRCLTQDFSDKP